jgi:radial spoke head protein 9
MVFLSTWKRGNQYQNHNYLSRIQVELALQQALANQIFNIQDLMFWGKITGLNADYYIAIDVIYAERYEFPEKIFYWASSNDFKFMPFDPLNDYNRNDYNAIQSLITGNPALILKKVEAERAEGEEVENQEAVQEKEVDPLASSEEEDPLAKIKPVNLKEIDRVHYLVRAIENDCHVVPQGAFKLTPNH